MKAIQTFWTNSTTSIDLMDAGWPDPRFHFMSWALSACLLYEQFEETVLFTDLMGKSILIDALKLPYKEVYLTQQELDGVYTDKWWVMRKIHSYGQVNAPFIHVDSDAFLWNGLSLNDPVIVQNIQYGFPCYNIALQQFRDLKIKMPYFFDSSLDIYDAVNMGIVGGNDYQLFQEFVSEVQNFYFSNLRCKTVDCKPEQVAYMNSLLEECFFYQFATFKQRPITALLTQKLESNYASLGSCLNDQNPITHLIGQNKKNLFFCKQMEFQLKNRFPDTYRRVTTFLQENLHNQAHYHSYKAKDPFALTNYFLNKNSKEVNIKNVDKLLKELKVQDKNQILSLVNFEKMKHTSAKRHMKSKLKLQNQEKGQSELIAKIVAIPLSLRLQDTVAYNPDCLLFSFKYPSRSSTTHSSLVYDFNFGCEHISHYNLDDLALFFLYVSQDGISMDQLIDKTFAKIGTTNQINEIELISKIEIKIRELVLLGLLVYNFSHES